MPLKARRALLAPDGTIYCPRGTVLADDDPVALANGNAVVGSTEAVTDGYPGCIQGFMAKVQPAIFEPNEVISDFVDIGGPETEEKEEEDEGHELDF